MYEKAMLAERSRTSITCLRSVLNPRDLSGAELERDAPNAGARSRSVSLAAEQERLTEPNQNCAAKLHGAAAVVQDPPSAACSRASWVRKCPPNQALRTAPRLELS